MFATKKILFLVYIFVFTAVSSNAHPFYVSIFQIDYNSENKSLEISVKIFADDLLFALEKNGEKNIFLGEEKERSDTDDLIYSYIISKFGLTVNGEKRIPNFIGKEMEADVVWTYLEIENINELIAIDVSCNLLTEIYPTQSNIIQVNNGKEIKNLLLNKRKTKDSLNF